MTKKLWGKLLSVILTIAVCLSTVLGCLITANAADAACYSWSEGTVDNETLQTATIELTVNATDSVAEYGIYAFMFDWKEVSPDDSNYLVLESAVVSAATPHDNNDDEYDLAGDFSVSINDPTIMVDYACQSEDKNVLAYYGFNSITLQLNFTFADGKAEMGEKYFVTVKDSSLELTDHGRNNLVYSATAVSGTINAGCDHVIGVVGNPINIDTDNGYSVYESSVCTICGEEFGYQLVPSTEPMNGTTITWSADGAYDDELIDAEDGEQLGTETSPIIINTVEELYYLATMAGIDATVDKYFKLADGIDNVVLQSEEVAADIMSLESAADVNTYFTENGGYKWDSTISQNVSDGNAATFAFAGNFDGNGATFYGLYDTVSTSTDSVGLFPYVYVVDNDLKDTLLNDTSKINTSAAISAKTITISNINLKNSHLTGTFGMGFIIGKSIARANEHYDWAANVKNCSIVNNYMYSNTGAANSVRLNGLIAGRLDSYMKYGSTWGGRATVNLNNCLVYGNSNDTVQTDFVHGISIVGISHRGGTVKNSIILGTTPYLPNGTGENDIYNGFAANRSTRSLYSNVYTDAPLSVRWQSKVEKVDNVSTATAWTTINYGADGNSAAVMFSITDNSVLGYNAVTSCPNLDWGNVWNYGADGEYPSIVAGTPNIVYWSGEVDTVLDDEKHVYSTQNGTKENPIIIDSAEELKYIAAYGAGSPTNNGKHYKIADEIDTIILQPIDVVDTEYLMSLTSADDVADYLTNLDGKISWNDPSLGDRYFNGNFDGNGVEIYGMYGENLQYKSAVGLFQGVEPYFDTTDDYVLEDTYYYDTNMDERITIGNFAIRNSYVKSDRRMGIVVGMTGSAKYGAKLTGAINFTDIEVSNCYAQSVKTEVTKADGTLETTKVGAQGILSGETGGDLLTWNNMLVYGNVGKFYDDSVLHLISQTGTLKSIPTGYENYNWTFDEAAGCIENTVTNSIILDAEPYNSCCASYRNCGKDVFENVYTDAPAGEVTFSFGKVTYDASDITNVSSDLTGVDFETAMPNLKWGTDWYTNIGGYPTLAALDEVRTSTTSNGAFGLVGSNISYNNDGSIDFNFHYIPSEGYEPVLYVGKADESGYTQFIKVTETTESTARTALGDDTAMMFTISNLSARDINTAWVPTLVATNGAVYEWGKSQLITIADYANGILNDEAVYAEDVTDETKLADKKVAAALLNYADAATIALNTQNDATEKTKIVYWDNTVTAPTDDSAGTQEDPVIINTPAELAYIATAGSDYTMLDGKNKYFKVADDIKAFVLQPKSYGAEIMALSDSDLVSAYYSDKTKEFYQWKGVSNTKTVFSGYFDGNGVTVYGLYNTEANKRQGLFGEVDGNVTISNVNVKGAYITTTTGWLDQGVIVGSNRNYKGLGIQYETDTGTTTKGADTLVIKNCTVTDCYMRSSDTTNDNRSANGVLFGRTTHGIVAIDNCFVNGNDTLFTNDTLSQKYALYGNVKNSWNVLSTNSYYCGDYDYYYPTLVTNGNCVCALVVDTVSIGTYPYHYGYYSNRLDNAECFINVYTDAPAGTVENSYVSNGETKSVTTTYAENQIKQITDLTTLQGVNAKSTASALDFESNWMTTSGYPHPIQSDYTVTGGKTLYWSGDIDTDLTDESHDYSEQTGEADNPIIIDSAEELAYIAGAKKNSIKDGTPLVTQFYETDDEGTITLTGPKHFKIADGIDKIVLQSSDYSEILNLTDSESVRKYFAGETGVTGFTTWAGCSGWNGDSAAYSAMDSFCGAFDGNGVEIYGIYQNSALYGGLFGDVRENATIENVTVKNSYIVNNTTDGYRVGGIIGYSDTNIDNGKNITLNKCIVANCYLAVYQSTSTDIGHLAGCLQTQDAIINDCAVYGNQAWYDVASGSPKAATFIGKVQSSNVTRVSDTIVLDAVPYGSNTSSNAVFSNVYTNAEITDTYTNITKIDDVNKLKGSAAADIVSALNGDNGTTWYVGAAGDYPGFEEADAMPNWLETEYNSVTFGTFDTYGADTKYLDNGSMEFGVYATALSLKANPYISFAFAFHGDYRTNRDQIKITFNYTGGSTTTTPPAYVEGEEIRSVNGWTNTKSAVRYHTYKLTDIPVEALVDGVTVTAEYEGNIYNFGTFSAEGLGLEFTNLNKQTPCDYYATRVEAIKALLFYTQMLYARYGSVQ